MPRKYEKKARAAGQEKTRQKIVEAAVELHGTIGPAQTSLSAIAARAGVQRHTLYRYFPNESAVFKACAQHYFELHPLPDVQAWLAEKDTLARLHRGLSEAYAHYEREEKMIANVLRDREVLGPPVGGRILERRDEMVEALLGGFNRATRPNVEAMLRLAVDFYAWRSLRDAGLSVPEAVEVICRSVSCLARQSAQLAKSK